MVIEMPLQRIMIVDDAAVNVRTLVNALMMEYEVMVATSGKDAIDIACKEIPDLILLDVVMPEMDGYEVCKILKTDPHTRHIPIIFVTGRGEDKDELAGLELGAVDYITKPFSLPIVQARVRTHLELKRYRDLLENYSFIDGLTGIPNRRRFDEFLNIMWRQAIRQNAQISLIMMDVDHFKAYNDHYGHQAGDECLRAVARGLMSAKRRATDLVARYGGEEFVCVLPSTDEDGAQVVAEQFRNRIEELCIPHGFSSVADHLTLSLGIATMIPQFEESFSAIIVQADQALYKAKLGGRNRVEGYSVLIR